MIIAITRDNEKLIYEVCKENGFESPQVLTGIKRFAMQELNNLNNYNQIIIDVVSTNETEDEIVQYYLKYLTFYFI